MKTLFLALLLGLVGLSFCHSDRANAATFNACSTWGTPDGNAAFGVMVCMGTGSAPPSACPRGTGFPTDGCAAAPAPLTAQFRQANAFQPGGYFNTVAATSADYTQSLCGPSGTAACRAPWNVAGVDYAIGNYTPLASLSDPATNPIAGCTYSTATSGTGGGEMTCGGSSFLGVVQHVNFGPVTGAGAHGCTALVVNGTPNSNTLLVDDFYFFNDTGLCSTLNIGGGLNSFMAVSAGSGYSGGVTVSNFYADGNSGVWSDNFGGCASPTHCNATVAEAIDFDDQETFKYGVVRNFAGRPMNGPQGVLAAFEIQYSWIEGWNARPQNGHSEWYNGAGGSGSPGSRNLTIDHDVVLQGQHFTSFGPAPVWWGNAWPIPIDVFNFTNNTQVNSFIGGGSKDAQVWGCFGASLVSATPATSPTCSGAGMNFYLTQVTGSIGQSEPIPISGTCAGGILFWLYTPITTPPGALGAWTIDTTTGSGIGPGNCTNVPTSAEIANNAVMGGHGPTPFGTSTVANNYIDPSSQGGSPPTGQDLYNMSGIIEASFTGSISGTALTTTTSQTLTTGAFINGVGITGCATNTLGCPRVASGSGTSWTLTASGGTVGPIAMTSVQLNWCTTPTDFHGNIDMAHLVSDAWMNQWSALANEVGC